MYIYIYIYIYKIHFDSFGAEYYIPTEIFKKFRKQKYNNKYL